MHETARLFLLGLLSLSLQLSSLLPNTSISLLTPQLPQLLVRTLIALWQITALHLGDTMCLTQTTVHGESTSDLGDGL